MPAKLIKLYPENYEPEQLKLPAQVMAQGGLVIFPTETVYGIGANANISSAVSRLVEIKQSLPGRPFTVHLSSAAQVYQHINQIPRFAHRLMRYFWPGPLTIILSRFNGTDKTWVGFRLPDNKIARHLIALSYVSIIASSANPAGTPPPVEAENLFNIFENKVDYIITAGPTKYRNESTVVRVAEDSHWEVLRIGAITPDEIKKLDYKMILFVCTGNTCRSPMAVGLFKKILSQKSGIKEIDLEKSGYRIISGGTAAIYNAPATSNAVAALKEFGSDISGHLSQPVTLTMIEEADEVFTMTQGHLMTLKKWAASSAHKIKLLDPAGEDITDPIGGSLETYRQCALRIKSGLEQIAANYK
ncbi:MAG: L-threonylcarbamoyladenylate synthase [Planctomycetota bacterium]